MAKVRLLIALITVLGLCAYSGTSFAKAAPQAKCGLNGDYSFFFWDPGYPASGVGFVSFQMDPATDLTPVGGPTSQRELGGCKGNMAGGAGGR